MAGACECSTRSRCMWLGGILGSLMILAVLSCVTFLTMDFKGLFDSVRKLNDRPQDPEFKEMVEDLDQAEYMLEKLEPMVVVYLVICLIHAICDFLLLHGAKKNIASLHYPFIAFQAVELILNVVLIFGKITGSFVALYPTNIGSQILGMVMVAGFLLVAVSNVKNIQQGRAALPQLSGQPHDSYSNVKFLPPGGQTAAPVVVPGAYGQPSAYDDAYMKDQPPPYAP